MQQIQYARGHMADNADTSTKLISYMHDAALNNKHNRILMQPTTHSHNTKYIIECSTWFYMYMQCHNHEAMAGNTDTNTKFTSFMHDDATILDYTQLDSSSHLGLHFQ